MRTKRQKDEFPEFPIEPVLLELGAEFVPTGVGWVKMRCPFHQDRTASAAVNHDINAFTCHGCEMHGDSVKLLEKQLGLSVGDAIRRASECTGVESRKPQRKRRASSTLLSFSGN